MSRKPAEVLREMNLKHAVITIGGKIKILSREINPISGEIMNIYLSPYDFRVKYSNQFVKVENQDGEIISMNIVKFWLSHPDRRQYDGIIFDPQPANREPYSETFSPFLNIHQGWPIKPVEGDCSLYWDHLKNIICSGSEELYLYIRNWMAHAIQFPQILPEVALVLQGGQGTGKDMFVQYFGRLFGGHFLRVHNMDQVTGNFNSHMAETLLLQVNEAKWTGKKLHEGTLKGLITDTTCVMERKGLDSVPINNFKRLIFCTNEQDPVPVDLDDRRFQLLRVSDKHQGDTEYFGKLAEQMDSGGVEALMYDLITEDLSGFDVRTKPKDDNLLDLKLLHAEPHVKWFYEKLEEGEPWKSQIEKEELWNEYLNWCKTSQMKGYHLTLSEFSKQLRKLVPNLKEHRPTINGQRVRLFHLPPLEESRKHFEKILKSKIKWPSED